MNDPKKKLPSEMFSLKRTIVRTMLVLVLGFFGWQVYKVFSIGGVSSGSAAEQHRSELLDAEVLCRRAISLSAKNPSTAEIPVSRNKGANSNGPGYVVNWNHGDGLRLQNGFGAMMDTTVSCSVNNAKVVRLVLNGNQVL